MRRWLRRAGDRSGKAPGCAEARRRSQPERQAGDHRRDRYIDDTEGAVVPRAHVLQPHAALNKIVQIAVRPHFPFRENRKRHHLFNYGTSFVRSVVSANVRCCSIPLLRSGNLYRWTKEVNPKTAPTRGREHPRDRAVSYHLLRVVT